MAKLENIKRDSLAKLIANALENWIFQEKFKPGERLKESHVAKQLGTSQTPVREALRILEERGIVTHVPDKGATVVNLSQQDISEMLALRRLLEPMALEAARCKATEEEKKQTQTLLEKLGTAAEENDLLSYHALHMEFHRNIWKLSHNQHLAVLLDRICAPLWAFYRHRVRNNSGRQLSGKKTHKPLVDFIVKSDPLTTTAQQLMDEHFEDVAGFAPKDIVAQ